MSVIVDTYEDSQGRWTCHKTDNGREIHVHHADGAIWLYPQVKYFVSVDDALAYVA